MQLVARGDLAAVDLGDRLEHARPSARGRACRAPRPWSRSSGRRGRRRRPPRRRCPTRGTCGSPGARTRARRRRGSSGACRRRAWSPPLRRAPRSATGRRRAAGWPATGPVRRISAWRSRSRSAIDERLRVGRLREHDPPRVDDHRAPAGAVARRVLADLVGGDHERLVLDRAGAEQDLPVLARGGEREGGRHEQDAGAPDREDPVQLREAQVVADAHPELDAAARSRTARPPRRAPRSRTPGRSCRRPRRRTCGSCGRRLRLAVGAEVHGGVGAAVGALDALGDRARHEVDAELACGRRTPT